MSPIQMGSLSVNNSVTNFSRLGTFKETFKLTVVLEGTCWFSGIFRQRGTPSFFPNYIYITDTTLDPGGEGVGEL
jgi:hypothetical protein